MLIKLRLPVRGEVDGFGEEEGAGPWVAPALLAAFLFVASGATRLIISYVEKSLDPYRIWVWVVFFLGVVAAAASAIIAARSRGTGADREADTATDHSISVGGSADGSQLGTGHHNAQLQAEPHRARLRGT